MYLILNKEDLEGNFMDVLNCPIYRSLKRNGFKVICVGGTSVGINGRNIDIVSPHSTYREICIAQEMGLDEVVIQLDVDKAVLENQKV